VQKKAAHNSNNKDTPGFVLAENVINAQEGKEYQRQRRTAMDEVLRKMKQGRSKKQR